MFYHVFDYTQITCPLQILFSFMSYYIICFLWDWFCLIHTGLYLVSLAALKSGDPWLPIHSHKWRARLTVTGSSYTFPPPRNICCPCWPFPSLGRLAVHSETEGIVSKPRFHLRVCQGRASMTSWFPSMPEKKSPVPPGRSLAPFGG